MADVKPPETVTLTIDGQQVTVAKGTTILKAAEQIGTRVPHYCYHDGLSSPAMCRLCLVEVEKAPKLQPACVTAVAEGQVVHTQSDKSLAMRRGVLEFYLQNHPLDCPICDQSGECKQQDYAHAEGRFHAARRLASSASLMSRCSRRASTSSSIMSPSRTSASGPPAAASGATCSTVVP